MNQENALQWVIEADERLFSDPYDFDYLDDDLSELTSAGCIDTQSSDWISQEFEHDMLAFMED